MKYLAICFTVFAVVSASLYNEEEFTTIRKYTKECKSATHVDVAKVNEMRKRHFDDNDQKIKDYLFCLFKKLDWQHEDGSVDKAHLEKVLSKSDVAKTAMESCIDKHGSTGAETAYAMYKCWITHLPADFKIVPNHQH